MKAVCDEAEMADFSKSSFLFPDTNPNKTKVMEDWFFILKQYLKASPMGCGSGNVLSEHSACFRKPPCLPWEGVAGTCHWQSSPDEWASIHPPGTRLLTSNSDKCANAACRPRLSEWLTSYNNARLDYSESCGRGAGLPTGLGGEGGCSNQRWQLTLRLKTILKFELQTLGEPTSREPGRVDTAQSNGQYLCLFWE